MLKDIYTRVDEITLPPGEPTSATQELISKYQQLRKQELSTEELVFVEHQLAALYNRLPDDPGPPLPPTLV